MSVFCPKCSKKTYNEERCDFCHYQIKPSSKPQSSRVLLFGGEKNNPLNTVGIIAIIIIAIALGYLAISHYQEKRSEEKLMEAFVGTSDPDEMIEHYKKSMKNINKSLEKSQRELEEKMRGALGNMGKSK